MPANVYECMFLLDTNKVAGDVPAAAGQLHAILERNHCEMLASRPWDERRLAYPVKGHKKGLYYLTYFRTDAKNLLNIGRDFALSELVLRSLTLKVDPKLEETMLSVRSGQLHAILERNHCEMLASRPWDERRLAYPVKGHKKGLYYLTYFRTDAKNLLNIGRDFALSELVLRSLTLKVDPKLEETMLSV